MSAFPRSLRSSSALLLVLAIGAGAIPASPQPRVVRCQDLRTQFLNELHRGQGGVLGIGISAGVCR